MGSLAIGDRGRVASEPTADDYRERRSRLRGAVTWERVTGAAVQGRVLPDGCTDLIWFEGNLMIAGPDTTAFLASAPGAYSGLRFAPGDGPAFYGVPASEIRDQRVLLGDIWPTALARRLSDRVTAAADRCAELEQLAFELMHPTDPAVTAIVASLRAGATVASTAEQVDMGERRLHRHCLSAFGYGPKTLARILRMNRALDLARAGTSFADVAARSGYADQAHLAREVKAMTGVPLSALVSPR
jgi:AraC-like DNA-binding protein